MHTIIQIAQGSDAWHTHRAKHYNASEASAMLGLSKYQTRAELLQAKATGLTPEVDSAKQRLFDAGHAAEAAARPEAEKILGQDLYPITATREVDGLPLSASYDGATMGEDIVWEHKLMNANLADSLANGVIPEQYHPQLEQQLLVIGADTALFMATSRDKTAMEYCWYDSNPKMRERLIAGWKQFSIDLAAYVPAAAAPVLVAEPVQSLPAVLVQVSGEIAIKDNFKAFEVALRDFLEHRLIREPKTDQDFADLDAQIKAMKGAEEALAGAETQMLAQVQSIDQAKKTKDMLAKLVRDNRLMAEKLLASEKDRRRAEIVAGGVKAYADHINGLIARIGKNYMPTIPADFAWAIKGMKSMSSMENAVATKLASAKIEASACADRIQANLETPGLHGYEFLFADIATICTKAADDFQNTVTARITAHEAAEAAKEKATRERIRAEEQAKAEREAREQLAREKAAAEAQAELDAQNTTPAPVLSNKAESDRMANEFLDSIDAFPIVDAEVPRGYVAPADAPRVVIPLKAENPTLIRLGQINERLAPISITADGLAQLGFKPTAIDKTAKLYRESDLPGIYAAMTRHIKAALNEAKDAA